MMVMPGALMNGRNCLIAEVRLSEDPTSQLAGGTRRFKLVSDSAPHDETPQPRPSRLRVLYSRCVFAVATPAMRLAVWSMRASQRPDAGRLRRWIAAAGLRTAFAILTLVDKLPPSAQRHDETDRERDD